MRALVRGFLYAEVLCARGGGVKIITDTRQSHPNCIGYMKSRQNSVGYAKKSSKECRICEKVFQIALDARKSRENGFLHLPKLDFHRFSVIFIGVLKIAENHEKQSFTFFAFLPPYIGDSGSLVSGMRKSVKRSIDWYQKFLISWLAAARYSSVFVFYCLWNVIIACGMLELLVECYYCRAGRRPGEFS